MIHFLIKLGENLPDCDSDWFEHQGGEKLFISSRTDWSLKESIIVLYPIKTIE